MNLFMSIWQLPQHIVGFIVWKVTKAEYAFNKQTSKVYYWHWTSGLSLGKYIFVPNTARSIMVNHEYGHSIQSRYLGWLYLVIIGLPSLIWDRCFKEYRKKHNVSYYNFYTEKWADQLGGVRRD